MDVKLIALNSKYVHTMLAPYYLKSACVGENIEIMQLNINQDIDSLYSSIIGGNPSIIGFSCYIFNINIVKEVAAKVKKNMPNIVIIFGGPEVSFDRSGYDMADYVISGEGEGVLDNLLKNIRNGSAADKFINGECVDITNIKSPYTDEYFEACKGKISYFEASRGCVFNCAYCMSGKSRLRKFPIEYVKTELLKFKDSGVRVIKFVDRTFNADKEFSVGIMRFILDCDSFSGLSFHFEIAGDLVDDEFLALVKRAPLGIFQFEIGVQSFNEVTLRSVCRRSDLDKLKKNIIELVSYGNCHIHTDLIAGLPYENLESFIDSFNTLYSLGGDMLQLGFLKVLKGSKLREELSEEAGYYYNNAPPYKIISTPFISKSELFTLKKIEEVVDKYYNSGCFKYTLRKYAKSNPFVFYNNFQANYSLHQELFDRYANMLDYLSALGEDKESVTGYLKFDYIMSNSSRVLPPCLKSKYDEEFKRELATIGINSKKLYCVEISINPNNGTKQNGIIAVDYSASPYTYNYYEYKN